MARVWRLFHTVLIWGGRCTLLRQREGSGPIEFHTWLGRRWLTAIIAVILPSLCIAIYVAANAPAAKMRRHL
jgi:hypothetical protein